MGSKPLRCLGGEDMVAAALVPFEIASGLAVLLLLLWLPMELLPMQLLSTATWSKASGGGEGGSWAGTRWPEVVELAVDVVIEAGGR